MHVIYIDIHVHVYTHVTFSPRLVLSYTVIRQLHDVHVQCYNSDTMDQCSQFESQTLL